MKDLKQALEKRAGRGAPGGSEKLRQRVAFSLTADTAAPLRRFRGPLVATAAAGLTLAVIGGGVWLIGGFGSDTARQPTNTVTATTPTSLPDLVPSIALDPDQIAFSVPGDEVSAIAVDSGSLWAWTGLGVARWHLGDNSAELFTSVDGLPFADGASGGIAVAPDGTVWAFAWNRRELARFDGTRWSEPAGFEQFSALHPRCVLNEDCRLPIMAIAVGPDGLLWVAVGEETLLRFDGDDWEVIPVTPSEEHAGSAWTTDMAVAPDGTLWIASWEELLAYRDGNWDRFTESDGLPSGGVGSVAVAPNGEVWVEVDDGSELDPSGGVARFDGDSWTFFDENDGLYDNAVSALTVGPDGTVWVVHGVAGSTDPIGGPWTAGVSRFDGTTWLATPFTNPGAAFGWDGATVDDTGTLWIASHWGAIGFDGTEATVLRFPEGPRSAVGTPPFTLDSEILSATESPIEWRWDTLSSGETTGAPTQPPIEGSDCYGGGGRQVPSAAIPFKATVIEFTLGHRATPGIAITGEGGIVTDIENPFGEHAWLCSVAATETHLLAVGSGVWWSGDGIAWNGIEVFDEFAGWNIDGSDLVWAAAGPGGYMVLGQSVGLDRLGWYSEDLQSWYEIPLEGGPEYSHWELIGPYRVGVGDELIIEVFDGAWTGTRQAG